MNYPIQFCCEVLEINRSSYYKWLNRKPTTRDKENAVLSQIILKYYEESNKVLGYRRMCGKINRELEINYNVKRISRIMKRLGLYSIIRKKKSKYQKNISEQIAENILGRDFKALNINEKWCCDVTEFKIKNTSKKIYLCAIIDLYDRNIVAYQLSLKNDNKLVYEAFKQAIESNPNARPIFHSDRGYQFTSRTFREILRKQGMVQSMSRVGKCIDNCVIEGWFGIIKSEMIEYENSKNFEELKDRISKYIEYYNNERYQERFNFLSPQEVRNEAIEVNQKKGRVKDYPIKINPKIVKYYQRIEEKNNLVQLQV